MKQNPLVSIVIVNWNGLEYLKTCFRSIKKQLYRKIELILVDNGSKDGSVKWIQGYYPQVIIIHNHGNAGYAEANNQGYQKAKGKYVLFLNNDTLVTSDFLVKLVAVFQADKTIGGAQSRTLSMDNRNRHDVVASYLTNTGFLYYLGFRNKDTEIYNFPYEMYSAKGACMMFRRDVLTHIELDGQLFDPTYFAYFEETDLCHRVWLSGRRIVYVYASIIYHKQGATSVLLSNSFVQYHAYKNRIHTYLKNLGGKNLFLILPIHVLCCEIYASYYFITGKIALWFSIQKAFFWNILHLPKILVERLTVQTHIRKVPDHIFWKSIYRAPSFFYYWKLSQVFQGLNDFEEDEHLYEK